ncbi:putative colanic acid biosysnthesis UDP-glucose lipid carrier transferase [Dyadobacter sp. SG02]|uniref:sugar transferase n=1 Tax=Dyadobacter sp. SG02 TaxID=1855291 RepID=UPI0008D14C85|nr:sugar transferase [Dyadobacter sp. SG02]SEJ39306.1 putative colanic acid biosysnthesis UDP-glucose lipid carrier transferase [Dyadobacter sp. SG02]
MKNRYTGLLPKAHLWADILSFNVSFAVAYYVRFDTWIEVPDHLYSNLLLIGNLFWVAVTSTFKTYQFNRISYSVYRQILTLLKACIIHICCILAFLYFSQKGDDVSRKQFLMTYAFFVFIAMFARVLTLYIIQFHRMAGNNLRTYAIIGKGGLAGFIDGFYAERKELGYRKCGNFEVCDRQDEAMLLENFLEKAQPDYIYCCLSEMNDTLVKGVIRFAERQKAQVRLIPDFRGFIDNLATIEYHDMYPIIQLNTKPFSSMQDETIKRVFDLIFSVILMVLCAPVFGLMILLVWLSSPGPVFFLQERSGRWGKTFKVIKFRTMYEDAEKFGLQHSRGDDDPRITPVGRLLRRSRLDELPQFLNVFKGDMSIVGPRPLFKYDVDMLMREVPQEFMTLLTVKPGITSIGQIKVGYASSIDENVQRLRHDLKYLGKYSMLTDVMLIAQTIQVMVQGRGR